MKTRHLAPMLALMLCLLAGACATTPSTPAPESEPAPLPPRRIHYPDPEPR